MRAGTQLDSTRLARQLAVVIAALLLAMGWAAPAYAARTLGFQKFDVGLSSLQASGHHDLGVDIDFTRDAAEPGSPSAAVRRLQVDLPSGIVGDLTAVPQCDTRALYGQPATDICAPATQVGVADIVLDGFGVRTGVYSMRPADPDNQTAWLVIPIAPTIFNSYLQIAVRTDGDYGLRTEILRISDAIGLARVKVTLWGVPMDPAHDQDRIKWTFFCSPDITCDNPDAIAPRPDLPQKPFLSNPTSCGTTLTARARATSFQSPDTWVEAPVDDVGQITGCDAVPFEPSLQVQPSSSEAGAATGYEVKLRVPQSQDPNVLSTANVRKAVIRLPPGVVLNPASAQGLGTCSDEQLRLGSTAAAGCPDPAKLGSVEIDAPIVGGTLKGGIYLRPPQPGKLFRVAIVANGFGVKLKIPGEVTPDPATGQLTTTFDDLPQLPFQELRVRFKDGDRAPLTNPRGCATHAGGADVTPWSGRPASTVSASFTIGEDCGAAEFSPAVSAGSAIPSGGAHSPFILNVDRGPAQPDISRVGATLPPGLTGLVASVPLCPQSAAIPGACGEESRIGSVTVTSGAGNDQLLSLTGPAFLTEGFGGAPFGLVFVVRAVAGPFDLGTVVIRSPIQVNRLDGSLSTLSEPLPTILEGIPLNVRSVRVVLDRPGFMLNPTNCDPMQLVGRAVSAAGSVVERGLRYQVGGCERLAFAPDVRAETSGRANSRNGASLKVHIGMRPGGANLRSATVQLPREIGPRLATVNKACVIGDFERGACSPASRVGFAAAVTPVLRQPLRGPVDLVVVPGQLPTLRVQLRGEVAVDLVGDVNISRGATTSFRAVPDIPITSFDLDLPMGPNSILTTSRKTLCGNRIRMPGELTSQSRRTIRRTIPVTVRDCPVRVTRATAGRRSVSLTVAAPGAGRLTASGKGVRTTRRSVRRGGSAKLTVPLTRVARRSVARGRRLRLRLKVSYRPARGAQARASSASARVTVRGARRR